MGEAVDLKPAPTTADKANLIKAAHRQLIAAELIDEHDTLGEQEALAWYDDMLPEVRDINVIAAALQIELAIRRRQATEGRGEHRRGDQTKTKSVSSVGTLTPRVLDARNHRKRDRHIGRQASAVRQYVKHAIATGCVPSMISALAAAERARPTSPAQVAAGQRRTERALDRFYKALEETAVAEQVLSPKELARRLGVNSGALQLRLRLVPWLKVIRESEGLRLQIDDELRAICQRRQPLPQVGGVSLDGFLHELREEIARRKASNKDELARLQWHSERVRFKYAFELLEWVEGQLDRVLGNSSGTRLGGHHSWH